MLVLFAGMMHAATASADGFAEVAGGIMTPGGTDAWVGLGHTSPKLAVRAGTMDRAWADEILSIDWTPIEPDEADTSAHRVRVIGSYSFNARTGALNLSARAGIGLDFLRVRRGSESDTAIGYAVEVGAGVWFATGPVELGGDIAVPLGLNGATTVGDLELDSYLSIDLDLLLGVRHVWR